MGHDAPDPQFVAFVAEKADCNLPLGLILIGGKREFFAKFVRARL